MKRGGNVSQTLGPWPKWKSAAEAPPVILAHVVKFKVNLVATAAKAAAVVFTHLVYLYKAVRAFGQVRGERITGSSASTCLATSSTAGFPLTDSRPGTSRALCPSHTVAILATNFRTPHPMCPCACTKLVKWSSFLCNFPLWFPEFTGKWPKATEHKDKANCGSPLSLFFKAFVPCYLSYSFSEALIKLQVFLLWNIEFQQPVRFTKL